MIAKCSKIVDYGFIDKQLAALERSNDEVAACRRFDHRTSALSICSSPPIRAENRRMCSHHRLQIDIIISTTTLIIDGIALHKDKSSLTPWCNSWDVGVGLCIDSTG